MEPQITIDSNNCKLCKTCLEICPNRIFQLTNQRITTRPERINLCFACGQCMAACAEKALQVRGLDYERDFFKLNMAVEQELPFQALIESRRSIRAFKHKPVPRAELEKIVEAISFAPMGFPPIKIGVVVVDNPEILKQALPLMIGLYDKLMNALKNPIARMIVRWKSGKEQFQSIQNHIIPLMNAKLPTMKDGTEDAIIRNAPAIILFHADRNAENYRADSYIALAFGLLKAHSLGLGATAIDLIPPAIERTPELKTLFKIPPAHKVVASMIVGYPKYKYQRGIKRKLASADWV